MNSGAVPHSKTTPLCFQGFEILFLLSLTVFPLFFGAVYLWVFSLGSLLLGISFFFSRCEGLGRGERVIRTDLDLAVAFYFLFFIISLTLSRIPYLSWIELFKLTVVTFAFFLTRIYCRERLQIYRLSQFFVGMGALLSVIGLLQFVGGLPKGWWSQAGFLSSMYVNHNHFAGLLVLMLPITFGLILAERNRAKKVLFVFMSVLMGIAFVFALSRGAFVALGVSLVWMVWILRLRNLLRSAVVPFLLFITLVVCAVFIFGTESITQRVENIRLATQQEELSMRLRLLTWEGSLQMIRNFFTFGSGPGTFGHIFLQFRPPNFTSMRPVFAHNDFLHLFAETGVFSFAAAGGLIFIFFRNGIRIIYRDDSRLRIGVGSGILAGMLGLLVHGLFDFNFHIPANWLYSVVAAGVLFSMDEDQFYSLKISSVLKTLLFALAVAVSIASGYLGMSDYHLWEAKGLLKEGEKKNALTAAEDSLRINSLNAEAYYLRGSIRLESMRGGEKESLRDFDEAIRRNPYEPLYELAKARVLVPTLAKESPLELAAFFEKAIEKDPNNGRLAYLVAKEAFEYGRAEKYPAFREAIGRLLERRQKTPAGRETLAELVAYLEEHNLWQYHRKYRLMLAGINPDEEKKNSPIELWNQHPTSIFLLKDFSTMGNEVVTYAESFFRNGELIKKINTANHLVRVVLRAKGSAAANGYPTLYVKIDGNLVDEYYVDSTVYKNYYTDLKLEPGGHLLSLQYINDIKTGGLNGRDRNVTIQRVSLLEAS